MKKDRATIVIEQAMLGTVEKMANILKKDEVDLLKKAPNQMDQINQLWVKFNRLFLEIAMHKGVLSIRDKEFLTKIKDTMDASLQPWFEKTELNKKQLQQAIKGLDHIGQEIRKEHSSRKPK